MNEAETEEKDIENFQTVNFKLQEMKSTKHHDRRIAEMVFGSFYPHYLSIIEKNGRTKEELGQVIE